MKGTHIHVLGCRPVGEAIRKIALVLGCEYKSSSPSIRAIIPVTDNKQFPSHLGSEGSFGGLMLRVF